MDCRYFGFDCPYTVDNSDGCGTPSLDSCPEMVTVLSFRKAGHTPHCASRMAWGDGECECGLRSIGNAKHVD